jgi:hypothetical protein
MMSMSMPTLNVCTLSNVRLYLTLTASWPPTRSGELFNCNHPDYRPVYAERAVRLARIRTPSGSRRPCAPIA